MNPEYYAIVCFQCLLVGDSEGQVTVLQLRSMPEPPTPEKQVHYVLILNSFFYFFVQ